MIKQGSTEILIETIETFIKQQFEKFEGKQSQQDSKFKELGIKHYTDKLTTEVIFDLGKPRCYFAITQFLDESLFNHPSLAASDTERVERIQSLKEKRQHAEHIACGIDGESGSITINVNTLSIYDKTLMYKLLMAPRESLPQQIYEN